MALVYEKKDKIAQITLNRPKSLNAFDEKMMKSFSRALIDFRDDPDAWVLIITGAGDKAFSAGFDLNQQMPSKFPPMITRGINICKPIIAAINGVALGGGLEVALACDLTIASDNATLGLPETRWGLMPGWGGTQRLARLISPAKAAEMILLAKVITAKEALQIGLINKVVSPAEIMKIAGQWAAKICELGPIAVRSAKMAINKGLALSLEEGLQLEGQLFGEVLKTNDAKEGPKAFAQKRRPEFRGR